MNMNEERILTLFEQRSEQALAETIGAYGAVCRSTARNILQSDEDAEEVVNDALLAVWNAIPPARPDSLRAYLLRLVQRGAISVYRASHREKRGGGQMECVLDEIAEFLPGSYGVEEAVEQREILAAVTAFLQGLPEPQRDLFIRRYWRAVPVQELAEDFGMTENHVKVTLSRTRARLQKHLRKEGLL